MTLQDLIAQIEALDAGATKPPMEIGVIDKALDPVEWFREHLSYGQGDIWCVHCPQHPKAIGPDEKPEHAILSAITGNGPNSEANAEFFRAARSLLPLCARLLKVATELRWWCHYCNTYYAEYVNGCPRCHLGEVGTSTSVVCVRAAKNDDGWHHLELAAALGEG